MSDIMKRLENYPDVSFIDNTSYQGLQDQMINDYERKLRVLWIPAEGENLSVGIFALYNFLI